MDQPELPGMPLPTVSLVEAAASTLWHFTIKLYPPSERYGCWFVIIHEMSPGRSRMLTETYPGSWLPERVWSAAYELVQPHLEALDPF